MNRRAKDPGLSRDLRIHQRLVWGWLLLASCGPGPGPEVPSRRAHPLLDFREGRALPGPFASIKPGDSRAKLEGLLSVSLSELGSFRVQGAKLNVLPLPNDPETNTASALLKPVVNLSLGSGMLRPRFGRSLGAEGLSLVLQFQEPELTLIRAQLGGPCSLVNPTWAWGAPYLVRPSTFEKVWRTSAGWTADLWNQGHRCTLNFLPAS